MKIPRQIVHISTSAYSLTSRRVLHILFLGLPSIFCWAPSSASQVANSKSASLVSYPEDIMQYVDLSCLSKYDHFVCTERHLCYIYCISKVVICLIVMFTSYLEVEHWPYFGKCIGHILENSVIVLVHFHSEKLTESRSRNLLQWRNGN